MVGSSSKTQQRQPAEQPTMDPEIMNMLLRSATKQSLKVQPPQPYDGTRGALRTFFTQLDLYFRFHSEKFAVDADKVLFASTYLRGPAFDWFNIYLRDFMDNDDDNQEDETKELIHNYTKFQRQMNRVFGDVDEERTAERRLQALRQTGSAAEYAAKFQQYGAKTQWDDAALTAQFYRGLKERVKDDIARGDRPTSLHSMITMAVRVDNRQYERELEKKGSYPGPKRSKAPARTRDEYGPVPMEIDAMTPKERRKETRKCYNCDKIGHLAKDCRQPKRQANAASKRNDKKHPRKKKVQLNATRSGKIKLEIHPSTAGLIPYNKPEAQYLRECFELEDEIGELKQTLQEKEARVEEVKAKIEAVDWEEDLISSFEGSMLGEKLEPLDKPILERQDATLSEIGDYEFSRWIDEPPAPERRDVATQVDLATASGKCSKKYWKGCTDIYCRKHLWEKRTSRFFPLWDGKAQNDLIHAIKAQQWMIEQCDQQDWELCFVHNCERHASERQAMGLDDSKN